jgi:polar amino acid transport system substrate-binding protein
MAQPIFDFERFCQTIAVIGALLCAGPSTQAAFAQGREFVVGVEELDYFPIYAVRSGQYSGAAREILDGFASDKGYRFEYRPLPVRRLTADLISGAVDFKFPDNENWASDQKSGANVRYSQPVIYFIDGTLVLPERKGRQKPETLGTISGFDPYVWLDRVKAGEVRLVENPKFSGLLRQALTGRIDAAYANIAVANYQLGIMGQRGGLVYDPVLPYSAESYRLSSAGHSDLIDQFDRWLTERQGWVEAIKRRTGAEAVVNETRVK